MSTCCGPTAFLRTELALSRGNEAGVILAWDAAGAVLWQQMSSVRQSPPKLRLFLTRLEVPGCPLCPPGRWPSCSWGTPGPRIFLVPSASMLTVHILLHGLSMLPPKNGSQMLGPEGWRGGLADTSVPGPRP